jgi:tRNA pseudouridine55 synthase
MARRGEAVPEKTKNVHVWSFAPTGELEGSSVGFRLTCSSGTYARSLAHELGHRLKTAAHLSRLRRLQIGTFSIENAVKVSEVESAFEEGREPASFIPFDAIPMPFEEIRTDAQQERRITHGQTVLVRDSRIDEGDWVKVVNGRREFVAVAAVVECIGEDGVRVVQPKIVFK